MLHFHKCLAELCGSESRAWHPLAPSWVPLPSPGQENRGCLSWVCLLHNAWVDSNYMFCVHDGGGLWDLRRMGTCVQSMLQLPCLPVVCFMVLRRLVKCAQSMLQLPWYVSENYAEWRNVYIRCVCCSTCPWYVLAITQNGEVCTDFALGAVVCFCVLR